MDARSPDDLLRILDELGIPYYIHRHAAVFSVADADEIDRTIPGAPTRNLFIRDKRETMFLVTLMAHRKIDLGKLADLLGAARISFGSPSRLMNYLGVTPGSVTPFAMVNDQGHDVTLILDREMMEQEVVNFHPLINTMTIGISPDNLLKFLDFCGCKARIVDLAPAGP